MMNKKQEKARLDADMVWWNERLPPGWVLFGFTYRNSASAKSPDNRIVTLDPILLDDLYKLRNTNE